MKKLDRFTAMLVTLGGLLEAVIFARAFRADWLAHDLSVPFAALAMFFLFCPERWWPR